MTICSSFLLSWSFPSANNINDFYFWFITSFLIEEIIWSAFKDGILSIWVRWSWWNGWRLYHCNPCIFLSPGLILKSNTVGCLYWLIVCVVNYYIYPVCSTWNAPIRPQHFGFWSIKRAATLPLIPNPKYCCCWKSLSASTVSSLNCNP